MSAASACSGPEREGDPPALLQLAVDAAREAGAMLREKLGTPLNIQLKSAHNDLVTDGDKASEALIVARIRAEYPAHRILAEEGTTGAEASPFRWLIDPVDGTTNFAHGVPAFAVSIGVEKDGVLLAGVVYNPAIDELFAAARGHGATLNEKPISVTKVWRPEEALAGCGMSAYNFQGRMVDAGHAFQRLTQGCRTTGAAAIDLCYVACGRFELFCGPSLAPWDLAAGALIVEEAGGEVSDFDGKPYTFERRDILASNGLLHPFALQVARGETLGRPSISAGLRRLRTRMALSVAGRGQVGGRRRR
jgi:myo-inositol-1(or 4)-monophosphatase